MTGFYFFYPPLLIRTGKDEKGCGQYFFILKNNQQKNVFYQQAISWF
ncbi:MAG: hypothetical protein UY23_C0001G0173 [Candidatus Jorgensenbacteria bacterium GW2011_GWA1_48_11]|uniref:Uncharacterized protein n=1 Tax=Candidatus Jorgensenbacteria bacterium GW2011_GWA1_48_11 TaxID=1618660 RepID=A0A0G1UBR3_9BACT|nr:MAG: hypothetical protein UY23_C0001G0173 [Candidatus Jorgensenbacteria bacterium GW2011_GWA1_48_11]KKW12060.1 MAG: hypothetical protein UY51_C0005G0302 [Candidatus Jorgensenbacteria bacterium GW2011_GWB1_49_9]